MEDSFGQMNLFYTVSNFWPDFCLANDIPSLWCRHSLLPRRKHRSSSIMVWAAISWYSADFMVIFQGHIEKNYVTILANHALPWYIICSPIVMAHSKITTLLSTHPGLVLWAQRLSVASSLAFTVTRSKHGDLFSVVSFREKGEWSLSTSITITSTCKYISGRRVQNSLENYTGPLFIHSKLRRQTVLDANGFPTPY